MDGWTDGGGASACERPGLMWSSAVRPGVSLLSAGLLQRGAYGTRG